MMPMTRRVCLAWTLVLCLGWGPALAGGGAPGQGADWSVDLQAGAVAGADVDDGGGSVAVGGAGATASWRWLSLSYSVAAYGWDDVSRLPFGNGADDPWDSLHSLGLDLRHQDMVDENWGYFAGGGLSADWEEEMGDSGTVHVRGGVLRALSPGLTLSLGAGAWAHKTGLRVLPVLALNYGSQDDPGFSATLGAPQTWLRYRFNPAWMVRLGARMDGGTYRLADDSVVAGKGYVRRSGVAAALMADWTPSPGLTLSAGPEWHFARSLTLYNKDGDEQDSYGVDAAPGLAARLRWAF